MNCINYHITSLGAYVVVWKSHFFNISFFVFFYPQLCACWVRMDRILIQIIWSMLPHEYIVCRIHKHDATDVHRNGQTILGYWGDTARQRLNTQPDPQYNITGGMACYCPEKTNINEHVSDRFTSRNYSVFNSLSPARCGGNCKNIVFKHIQNGSLVARSEFALTWML